MWRQSRIGNWVLIDIHHFSIRIVLPQYECTWMNTEFAREYTFSNVNSRDSLPASRHPHRWRFWFCLAWTDLTVPSIFARSWIWIGGERTHWLLPPGIYAYHVTFRSTERCQLNQALLLSIRCWRQVSSR
jgi:hypothetical protein